MHFGQLLMGQGGAEVGVVLGDQLAGLILHVHGQAVVAGLAAPLGDECLSAAGPIGSPQALDLAHRQVQVLGGLRLGNLLGLELLHHFGSTQFVRAHTDQIIHFLRVLSWLGTCPSLP